VVTVGGVSTATLANGFVGYAGVLAPLPAWTLIVIFVGGLGALAAWGINQSMWVAAALTVVEVGGLIVVIIFAGLSPDPGASGVAPADICLGRGTMVGVFGGTVLVFFAFIGFEDMVNVAEEVEDVKRTLPMAIILTLVASSVTYTALTLAVVFAVPAKLIAQSTAPLALVFTYTTGWSGTPITVVGILAVVNGALVQIIMAARVLYGLPVRAKFLP